MHGHVTRRTGSVIIMAMVSVPESVFTFSLLLIIFLVMADNHSGLLFLNFLTNRFLWLFDLDSKDVYNGFGFGSVARDAMLTFMKIL